MANKETLVINYLLAKQSEVSIDQIMTDCGVSKRSVYNYLSNIKGNPDFQLHNTKTGIRVIYKTGNKLIPKVPETYEERRNFIYRKGLILQRSLSINDLLNYFHISESTFHSEIIKIRNEIRQHHVRLKEKNGILEFSGNPRDLKKLTQDIIYQESDSNHSLLTVDKLSEIFPNLDVKTIKGIIQEEFNKSNYFMDEYSIVNFLMHVLIALNQDLNGHEEQDIEDVISVKPTVTNICQRIENIYPIQFSSSAKNQFSLLLSTRGDHRPATNKSGIILKNANTGDIAEKIFETLYSNFNFDMNVSELKYPFVLHLDSLLTRLKSGVSLYNPLLSIIKQSSPITYDLAVCASNVITKETNYQPTESEIAYIALHLGTRIEEIKAARTKLNAIIVCPEYFAYGSRLSKIIDLYNDDLYVSDVFSSYDEILSLEDIDLIICTVMPSSPITGCYILRISSFLTSEDRKQISETIEKIKYQNIYNRNIKSITSIFQKELFYTRISFERRDDAIHFMSNRLYQHGYVSEDYESAILYRENVAPTDFNMIAIPHPAEYNAHQTVISVATLSKQLHWNNSNVSIIMMIAVSSKDFNLFDDVFSSLVEIAQSNETIRKLSEANDYDDFIEKLCDVLQR